MALTFSEAIAREEGFNVKGSRAQRNNNPGNLNFAKWQADLYGATLETARAGEVARFACFPTAMNGFNALRHLVVDDYLGLTLRQAIYKWAPPTENHSDSYVQNVATWMEVSPDTVLTMEIV